MFKKISLALPLALALVTISIPAHAAIVTFTASIDGAQANAGAGTGSAGLGSAIVTFDDVTKELTLVGSFSGLTSPGTSTNAHIHGPAAPGVNGGVLVQMTFDAGVSAGAIGVAPGTFLNAAAEQALLSELTYINIHSTTNPGGEIRGQLLFSAVPEPSSALLLGFGSVFAFLRRRRA